MVLLACSLSAGEVEIGMCLELTSQPALPIWQAPGQGETLSQKHRMITPEKHHLKFFCLASTCTHIHTCTCMCACTLVNTPTQTA